MVDTFPHRPDNLDTNYPGASFNDPHQVQLWTFEAVSLEYSIFRGIDIVSNALNKAEETEGFLRLPATTG